MDDKMGYEHAKRNVKAGLILAVILMAVWVSVIVIGYRAITQG